MYTKVLFALSVVRHDLSLRKCSKQKKLPSGHMPFFNISGGDCLCLGHLMTSVATYSVIIGGYLQQFYRMNKSDTMNTIK